MKNNKTTDKNKPPFNLNRENLIKYSILLMCTALLVLSILWGKVLSTEVITGTALIVALLLLIMYKDFIRYKPEIKKDYKMLILIGLLLATC